MENADARLSRLELARQTHPTATDPIRVRTVAAQVIEDLGVTEPPVDVEMVASSLGIASVTIDPDLPVAGCLLRRPDNQFEIRVCAADPPGRQRFTVGHECGHTFFPGYTTTQYRCSPSMHPAIEPVTGATRNLETLCDLAASELLLPSKLFVPDARSAPFGFDSLEDLADRYGASLEATGHRLVTARREPAAFLVLTVRQKPSEAGTGARPHLRLDYALRVGDWPYFMPHKSVTPGGVFDRALHGETVSETTTITDLCLQPARVEVHAQSCPLTIDGTAHERVVALARRSWR